MSFIKSSDELLEEAQKGKKLKPKERLQVVVHLEKTKKIDDWPEHMLAVALGCSRQAIRKYRAQAREIFAASLSPEEAMNILADFSGWYDFLIKEARAGLDKSTKGSQAHQAYLRIIGELWDGKVTKLQSVGVIPKELGRLTTIAEEWVATADLLSGVVSCQQKGPGE